MASVYNINHHWRLSVRILRPPKPRCVSHSFGDLHLQHMVPTGRQCIGESTLRVRAADAMDERIVGPRAWRSISQCDPPALTDSICRQWEPCQKGPGRRPTEGDSLIENVIASDQTLHRTVALSTNHFRARSKPNWACHADFTRYRPPPQIACTASFNLTRSLPIRSIKPCATSLVTPCFRIKYFRS